MRTLWKTKLMLLLALGSLVMIARLSLLLAQNGAQSQPSAGTGSLSGQLLDATTSTAVKGKVALWSFEAPYVRTVSTDERGAYQFAGLAPGIYKVDGAADGYLGKSLSSYLVLRAGQQLHEVNLQLVLAGSVSGSVHDPAGLPLAEVAVQLVTQDEHPWTASTVNTNENGEFHMSGIWPRNYYVRAIPTTAHTDAAGMPTDVDPVYFAQARGIAGARRVTIVAGKETAAIDLTMTPPPTYTVTGRIIDGTSGKPVSQGGLSALHNDQLHRFVAHSNVAADGSFRLEGMPAGHYEMVYRMLPGTKVSRLPEFDLGDKDVSGVLFTAKPGIVLRGHVVTSQPLPQGFYLLLAARERVEVPASIQVKADGSFECPDVYPGDYDLEEVFDNVWHIRELRLGDKVVDTKTEGILVKDDARLPDMTVVVDSQVTTISGMVTDESGAPQPGITVILMRQSTKRWPQGWLRSRTSGLDGRYSFENVIPGEYWMLAWPRAAASEARDPNIFARIESETTPVHVGASPITQDLKLTSKTKAVAEGTKTNSVFPAKKY